MKKFCPNCGAEIENGTVFCGNCGEKIPQEETAVTAGSEGASVKASGGLPFKINVKLAAVIGAAAFVIIIIAVASAVILSSSGSKGFLKKTMKAVINSDAETLADNTSYVVLDYLDDMNMDKEDYAEVLEESIGSSLSDVFGSSVGHNYKTSYKVDEIYTASERELSKALTKRLLLASSSFIEDAKEDIDKMVIADVEITAKQNKKSKTVEASVYMTKEEGKWRCFYIEFD